MDSLGILRRARWPSWPARALARGSINEFTPVAAVGGSVQCLVVHPSIAASTLGEFAAYARSQSKPLLRGSNNAAEDLVAGQITGATSIKLDRVRYKGGAQMLPDLLEPGAGGSASFGIQRAARTHGQAKFLGCSASERFAALPNVPTLAEAGVSAPPLVAAHFLLGPPRLPDEIVGRLSAAVQRAAQTAEFKREMERLMIDSHARDPARTRELMIQSDAQYAQFARETGASLD